MNHAKLEHFPMWKVCVSNAPCGNNERTAANLIHSRTMVPLGVNAYTHFSHITYFSLGLIRSDLRQAKSYMAAALTNENIYAIDMQKDTVWTKMVSWTKNDIQNKNLYGS